MRKKGKESNIDNNERINNREDSCNIFCVLILLVILLFIIKAPLFIYIVRSNKVLFNEIAENDIITTGLTIIGLAIAVWTGLNISNAVSRREVEELKAKTENLQKQSDELTKIYDSLESLNRKEFFKELLKTSEDVMSNYFYNEFQKNDQVVKKDFLYIEQLFNQIYDLHTKEETAEKYIIEKVDELEKNINKILEKDKNNINKLTKSYLNYRKVEGLFYKGYKLKDRKEIDDNYDKAIKMYEELASEFGIKLPKYDASKIDDDNYWKSIYYDNHKLFAYYANTMGESYNEKIEKSFDMSEKETIDLAKRAVFYCKHAVNCAKIANISREIYYRNLGRAYERLEKAQGSKFNYSDKILENYIKAFSFATNKPQISKKQVGKIYHTTLSYYHRYIKNMLGLLKISEDIDVENIINCLNVENKEKLIDLIKSMNEIATIAINDDIRKSLNIVMFGFSNGYIILSKMKYNNYYFSKDNEYYLEKMKWSIDTLKLMKIDDDYFKELRAFYEKIVKIVM